MDTRAVCEASIYDFLSEDAYRRRVRRLIFKNEWEEHLRADDTWELPSPLSDPIFGPLRDAVETILDVTSPEHISFRSWGVVSRTLLAVSRCHSVQALTFENCFLATFFSTPMCNIVRLQLGFGISPLAGGRIRDTWLLMTWCPQLRHLYAYPLEAGTAVPWPETCYTHLTVVHQLQTLHLQGMDDSTSCLHSWVEHAMSVHDGQQSRLSSMKLHTSGGMSRDQLGWVLKALRLLTASLKVLVLDGLHYVPSSLVRDMCLWMPLLEGLSVFRRSGSFARRTRLCRWEEPTYAYARALSHATHLQHFEANFMWTRFTYGPSALDALPLVHAPDDAVGADPSACLSRPHAPAQSVLDFEDELLDEGRSMVLPFAALCSSLQSFAVTADFTFFSCDIHRLRSGAFFLTSMREDVHVRCDDRWNPFIARTW